MRDRTDYGHQFLANQDPKFWMNSWGPLILVFPPGPFRNGYWKLFIPKTDKSIGFTGETAEQSAFLFAAIFSGSA